MHYLIIGTGPSIKDVKLSKMNIPDNVITISVNTSITFFKSADIWFSLDPSYKNIKCYNIAKHYNIPCVWALKKNISSINNCAYKHKYILNRVENYKKSKDSVPNTPKEWFNRWSCVPGLSNNTNCIHTGNSVYGALNLAFHDKPNKISILGLDGIQEKSVGGNHYPKNLSHLPLLFNSSVKQLNEANIQVVNGSPHSEIKSFERVTPTEAIKWLEN